MQGKLNDEMMEYIGILAQLELTESEKEKAAQDMEKMLDYIDKLNELDTESEEPMTHVFPLCNVFREDEVTNEERREEMLANAPKTRTDSMWFRRQ